MIKFVTVKKAFGERTHVVVLILGKGGSAPDVDSEEKSWRDATKIYKLITQCLSKSTLEKLVCILYAAHPRLIESARHTTSFLNWRRG